MPKRELRECAHAADAGGLKLVDLRSRNVGHAIQVVVLLPLPGAEFAPATLAAAFDLLRIGLALGGADPVQVSSSQPSEISQVIVNQKSLLAPITEYHVHVLGHDALNFGQHV